MEVTFTRVDDKRYLIAVVREHGPALLPRPGPGRPDPVPHDLAHWVVEEHHRLALGVWGQLAAGGGGYFYPAPEDDTLRHRRLVQRLSAAGRDDMVRSEHLAQAVVAAWRHAREPRGAVARLDEAVSRWRELGPGRGMTLTWPRDLTVDPSRPGNGRRGSGRVPVRSRH